MARKKAFNPGQAATLAAARKPPTAPRKPAVGAHPKNQTSNAKPQIAAPGGGIPKASKANQAVKKPAKPKAKLAFAVAGSGAGGLGGAGGGEIQAPTGVSAHAATGVFAEMEDAKAQLKRKAGAEGLGSDQDPEGEVGAGGLQIETLSAFHFYWLLGIKCRGYLNFESLSFLSSGQMPLCISKAELKIITTLLNDAPPPPPPLPPA